MRKTRIRSDGYILENINLAPETVEEEVMQNVAVILASVKNTVPCMYDFGIDGTLNGRPLQIIKNMIVGDVFKQIADYEPRAEIGEIEVELDEKEIGSIIVYVELMGVNLEDGDDE